VQLSAAALGASAMATHARLGGPGRWLLALPAQHVAGLQVLVRAALAGVPPAVLDLRGGFDPAAFGVAAQRVAGAAEGRCYTALVPTQLVRLLDTDSTPLTRFDAVLLGGAAAPGELLRRAQAAGVRVVTTYGMTETAGGCVYDGWPLDGIQIRVDGEGSIELAGPMLATGYLDAPNQTAVAFRDGWFRTCDLGRLNEQGRLQVLGRVDDMILTGGLNVAPAEVEAVLTGLPGVAAACVVGLPDPEWGERVTAVVVPADPRQPPDLGALRMAARRLLPGTQVPKEIILFDALPLRGVGKPDRRAVRTMLAARDR
jgi:O-succinylbenzoic acid--CoA ligase